MIYYLLFSDWIEEKLANLSSKISYSYFSHKYTISSIELNYFSGLSSGTN